MDEGEDEAWWAARDGRAASHFQALLPSKTPVVCSYHLKDRCRSGALCPFLHDFIPDKVPLCAYVDVVCPDGAACVFRHERLPHELARLRRSQGGASGGRGRGRGHGLGVGR
jgi:hypothetical protein